jgi:hypothetical protein
MAASASTRVAWKQLWAQRGFRYFFTAMFVSLFGNGMKFSGVSWQFIETDCLCAGIFSSLQDCTEKRKNLLDTAQGKFFAGGVARS